ncbi:hypothetical protein [Rhodobacter sp. NSM]|uniref:hypothetical protein n=1 Tax=Rhodobacter sp. NSM TaxID=3457501 RepID=UPI003FD4673F
MYDYGQLVFLDNQKTGSTFVSHFLRECCSLKHVKSKKHHPIRNDYRRSTVYFSTVRHPVDLYTSLYQYGLDGKGSTLKRIKAMDRMDLYKDLSAWLDFILDEANAAIFKEGYDLLAPLGVGFMSFRAMRITLQYPAKAMSAPKSYDEMVDIWKKYNIAHHIFRQEDLNSSLYKFAIETVPEYFHKDKVETFLNTSERVNVTLSKADSRIPAEQLGRILQKERFLVDQFYSNLSLNKQQADRAVH